ncbi:uncharacterized protein LOC111633073 [Centruroides sculpturatus]|uniref:uncharacterized protein LOC111633073 n=1 Tax=Centruroides sculpturatus TaxID=218467 RepID=UPI000C6CC617|nr:uncharacterized protein LOC111633073 [Centruroides sculpturatus]
MTVMDYKALYPSIRLLPCFCALRDFLFTNIKNARKYHKHILELVDLVCYTSFFNFEEKTYLQGRGVLMGNPMSAVLCELVLHQLESNILPIFQNDIILYCRYIDDIFILWRNDNNVQCFLNTVNNNPYGLTLDLEQGSGGNINFLNLSIMCKEGEIWTDIYRKPIYQPIIIPRNSIDPRHIKYAAFWAYTHCTSVYDTYKELDYIRKTAMKQGYRRREVDELITKFQNQNWDSPKMIQERRVVLNYFPLFKQND